MTTSERIGVTLLDQFYYRNNLEYCNTKHHYQDPCKKSVTAGWWDLAQQGPNHDLFYISSWLLTHRSWSDQRPIGISRQLVYNCRYRLLSLTVWFWLLFVFCFCCCWRWWGFFCWFFFLLFGGFFWGVIKKRLHLLPVAIGNHVWWVSSALLGNGTYVNRDSSGYLTKQQKQTTTNDIKITIFGIHHIKDFVTYHQ